MPFRNQPELCGVYERVSRSRLALFACLAVLLLTAGAPEPVSAQSVRYPWTYPGNVNQRIRNADVVIGGTIVSTTSEHTRILDGVEVMANQANIRIDRIFKGLVQAGELPFRWFSPAPVSGRGVIASLPPLARFRKGDRYLVFLRRTRTEYVVTVPIYAIEVPLAAAAPSRILDLSQAPEQVRRSEIAQELETAALSIAKPDPGVTGEAAIYFPYVVDLIGGCAEPFLRHFAESQSRELAGEAQRWLAFLAGKHLHCDTPPKTPAQFTCESVRAG